MSLTNLIRSALFGAALTLGCAAPQHEPEISAEVLQATSDRTGFVDFPGTGQDIYIKDTAENYLGGAQTTVYKISRDGQYAGDVYTAQAGEQGGINVYLHPSNTGAYLLSDRQVITYAPDQPPSFGRDYRQLTLDLLRWIGRGDYTCDGIFTTAQLNSGQGRGEDLFELITFRNADGVFNSIYNRMGNLRERDVLRSLPANKEWAVLTPNHPRATPETFQLDLARQIYSPEAYRRIVDSCSVPTDPCADTPGLLFCDDFSGRELDRGKWEGPGPCGGTASYLLNGGILEFTVNGGGSCIMDDYSTRTLGNSTFTFETRWKVGEREETNFDIGLVSNDDHAGDADFAVMFSVGHGTPELLCFNYTMGRGEDKISCDAEVTQWIKTKLILNQTGARYFINDEYVATSMITPLTDKVFSIDIACSSADHNDRLCFIDYVKLVRE